MIRNEFYAAVKKRMVVRGMDLGDVAKKTYTTRQTIGRHLHDPKCMTVGEVKLVMDAVGMTAEERAEALSILFGLNLEVKRWAKI